MSDFFPGCSTSAGRENVAAQIEGLTEDRDSQNRGRYKITGESPASSPLGSPVGRGLAPAVPWATKPEGSSPHQSPAVTASPQGEAFGGSPLGFPPFYNGFFLIYNLFCFSLSIWAAAFSLPADVEQPGKKSDTKAQGDESAREGGARAV